MTLDEAIVHAQAKAAELSGSCAEEHRQLAAWLVALRRYETEVPARLRQAFHEGFSVAWNGALHGFEAPTGSLIATAEYEWDKSSAKKWLAAVQKAGGLGEKEERA